MVFTNTCLLGCEVRPSGECLLGCEGICWKRSLWWFVRWLRRVNSWRNRQKTRKTFGLDNWGCQSGDRYERRAKRKKIKFAYTPADCTELCGVTDVGPGNEVKKGMVKRYRDDLRSSRQRLEEWKLGKFLLLNVVFWRRKGWETLRSSTPLTIKIK